MSFKSRNFCMVLYPDDDTHKKAVDLLETGGYSYCGILHDKDIFDDDTESHNKGDLKKKHWHIVLCFKNARVSSAVASELGLAENYLQSCRNVKGSLLYLLHYNTDKVQYDLDLAFGSLKDTLSDLLQVDTESRDVLALIALMDSIPEFLSYKDLLILVCKNGLYSCFRRLGYGVKMLLQEHNDSISYIPNSMKGESLNG